jgi:hypothetical protein
LDPTELELQSMAYVVMSIIWFVVAVACYAEFTQVTHIMTALGLAVVAIVGKHLWLGVPFLLLNLGAGYRTVNPVTANPYYRNSRLQLTATTVSVGALIGLLVRFAIAIAHVAHRHG